MNLNKESVAVKTSHIFHMTDDTGILQHAIYGVPNLSEGYTSDDNARALIMAIELYDAHRATKIEDLIYTYISFLCHAQNDDGTFRNFMGYSRVFLGTDGSEDCFGRCLWALCYTFVHPATPQNAKQAIWTLIEKALPNCAKISAPRAQAYVLIGLACLNAEETNKTIVLLADSLTDRFAHCSGGYWHWFEDSMTYCNAILPWAMLTAFRITKVDRYRQVGIESLKFLESKTFKKKFFKPIGCNGWLNKGDEPAEFDEQPVEACETMLAYLEAFALSGNNGFFQKAKACFFWYLGENSKGLIMIDPETGGCYDGIQADGLNKNQGAESVVSFWIAYLTIKKYEISDSGKTVKIV